MSSFASYNRRPTNSNAGYYPNNEYYDQYPNYDSNNQGYSRDYDRGRYRGSQNYNYSNNLDYDNNYDHTYDSNYGTYGRDYQDDHTRSYGPRRRVSYNNTSYHPDSPATYSNLIPSERQNVTSGGQYATRSSRRKPTTYNTRPVVQAVQSLQNTSNSASGFRAHGERGENIPVSNGLSYFEEGIPLSIWIRRLFGLGPRRSKGHVGQSVHVKRWDMGRGWFTSGTGRSSRSVYTI